jgi:hypothetical protein
VIRVGTALQRLADELTAVLGGLLGYVAVLAALGVTIAYLLEIDGVNTEPGARTDQVAMGRPYVIDDDQIKGPNRPELRRAVATR